jgi:hypothetical protein
MREPNFETRRPAQEQKIENYQAPLTTLMSDIANAINRSLDRFKDHPKTRDLVDSSGSINMRSFWKKFGGPYEKDKKIEGITNIYEDEACVSQLEEKMSGSYAPGTLDWYKDKYRLNLEGDELKKKVIEIWKDKREREPNKLLEMAITAVLYKILKSEFAVVRSSTYDDYKNGVDNVIVNVETGDVVCAFDEVHDVAEDEGKRMELKMDKVIKTAKNGGSRVKYGFTFENDAESGKKKMVKGEIRNIPKFYLGLSTEELKSLLSEMSFDVNDDPGKAELNIFDKLITLLEKQVKALSSVRIDQRVKDNLANFVQSLNRMKEIRRLNFGS